MAFKKCMGIVLAFAILLSGVCSVTNAVGATPNEENVSVEMLVEHGSLSHVEALNLKNDLNIYFQFRQNSYVADQSIQRMMTSATEQSDPMIQSLDRNDSLRDFWAKENVDIVSIQSVAEIQSVIRNSMTDTLDLDVYEWTWVYYNNGDGPNSEATDYMGFATQHDITMELQTDGNYSMTADVYDEADISGYTVPGYMSVTTENISVTNSSESLAIPAAQSSLNRDGMPYVWNAIVYADTWVKHDIASGYTAQDSYYNPTYGKAGVTTDCSNYVNQCLSNSGFRNDPQSASSRVTTSSEQFWHNRTGSTTSSNSSCVWRTVSGIIAYWGDRYTYENINSSKSNVFPGNPVITSDEGHVAICVGYNSAGVPIINGHTRDVFHQVLSGYAKTIKINTTNRLGSTPEDALTMNSFPYSHTRYLGSEQCKWYKFTVPSGGGSYRFTTTGTSTVQGTLYKATEAGTNGTMAMYPLTQVNGSNNITLNSGDLTAGTYFLLIKHVASSSTGSYTLSASKLS